MKKGLEATGISISVIMRCGVRRVVSKKRSVLYKLDNFRIITEL